MKEQKKGRASYPSATPTDSSHSTDNSAEAQRARLLEALRRGPMTTLEIRRQLDILAPAPRIYELRHDFDKNIQTIRVAQATESGHVHSVAKYALLPDAQSDLFADAEPRRSAHQ